MSYRAPVGPLALARTLLGVGLCTTAACTEADVPAAIESEEIEFRNHLPDARLPTSSAQNGPDPAYEGGVVTTTEPLAAEVGREILLAGGNAIDAAFAVQFMLNVVEPQSSGIGGGGVMLIRLAGEGPEDTIFIDFRDMAPYDVDIDMYDTSHSSDIKGSSGYSVGVPGTVKAMLYALERYGSGKLTRAELMAPAIYYARYGFNISSRLAGDTGSSRLRLETSTNQYNLGAYAEARKVFRPGGSTLKPGYLLKQSQLAIALERIRDQGEWAFYDCSSPMAKAIVDTQRATRTNHSRGRGRMTCEDLENYELRIYDGGGPDPLSAPLIGDYHGYTVVTSPPPTSGAFLLQQLDLVEALESKWKFAVGAGSYEFGELYTLNIMQEVMRLAFSDRARWLGDPVYYPVPTEGLLASDYIQQRAGLVTPGKRRTSYSAGTPSQSGGQEADEQIDDKPGKPGKTKMLAKAPYLEVEGVDTTHFTIIDGAGNAVSLTSTLSNTWGSGLMVKGYGFMLNNQSRNFNDAPVGTESNPGPNDVEPYKRPRTTLCPTMLFLGDELVAAYGAPGDTGILHAVFQVTLNLISHGMALQAAVEAPRIGIASGSSSADTERESGFSSTVISQLDKMGYDFDLVSSIGAVQAIMTYPGNDKQYGAADWRRIGGVAGVDK